MSRLSKFFGKPKEIEIEGEKFLFHPLKGKHLLLFMQEAVSGEEKYKISKEIIKQSLLPSEPEITDEEIDELEVKVFNKLLEAAMDVNGMTEDERIRLIKEKTISKKA